MDIIRTKTGKEIYVGKADYPVEILTSKKEYVIVQYPNEALQMKGKEKAIKNYELKITN